MEWFDTNIRSGRVVQRLLNIDITTIVVLVLLALGAIVILLPTLLDRGRKELRFIPQGFLLIASALVILLFVNKDALELVLSGWYYPVVILLCALVVVALFLGGRQKWDGRSLAYAALCIAIGFVLSTIRLYRMPAGGSVVLCAILPLVAFSVYAGVWRAILVCVAYGLLQMLQGAWIVHPVQGALDYIVAYAVLGLAGLVNYVKIPERWKLPAALVFTGILRWAVHVISGLVFFAADAPPEQGPLLYSALYNLFLFPEVILAVVITLIPGFTRMFEPLKAIRVGS